MFHLDNNSGISSMPKPAAQQSAAPRWFTEGSGNDSPSWPGQDWFNIVQAELLNVLSEAGIPPVKTTHTQLAQAIKDIIAANSNVKNALLKGNNLSDLENKSTARKNLELGTVAVKDVVTSTTDSTSGRIPVVGWMGLGTGGRNTTIEQEQVSSFWRDIAQRKSGITIPYDGTPVINYLAVDGGNLSAYVGRKVGSDNIKWVKLYSEYNKPTAADVGALPIKGGTLTGDLAAPNIQVGTRGNAAIHIGDNDSGLRNSVDGQVDFYANGALMGHWNPYELSYNGTLISKAANGLRLAYGDYGFIVRNDGGSVYFMLTNAKDPGGGYNALRPITIHCATGDVTLGKVNITDWTNIDGRYYTKTQSDQKYQPKGNFTPAGEAYTKAESNGRYVQNMRLGARTTTPVANNNWSAANGGVITEYNTTGQGIYRLLQVNRNGTWATIAVS